MLMKQRVCTLAQSVRRPWSFERLEKCLSRIMAYLVRWWSSTGCPLQRRRLQCQIRCAPDGQINDILWVSNYI